MPRSPILNAATKELAQYFGAITDADYIDRTWGARLVARQNRAARAATITTGSAPDAVLDQLNAQGDIYRAAAEPKNGSPSAEYISDLINGAMSVAAFLDSSESLTVEGKYREQFAISGIGKKENIFVGSDFEKISGIGQPSKINSSPTEPTTLSPNVYAVTVSNPALGPSTRDMGPIEVFMNAMPTLELSKCVPYVNVELVTARPALGPDGSTLAPTLLRFLNPPALGSADTAMLGAQAADVRSEVLDLGVGTRVGMELFTSPQTLVNMDAHGFEFVPVIDRLRPLASLGELSISVKMQKNTSSFSQIRMEITIHDRSRLREVADLVRPDLYGRTFVDVTYGWSHPEGGLLSKNSFGKFLDALKVEGRYRIATSSYTFEEGGSVKVSMNLFSVGSTDLLSLSTRATRQFQQDLERMVRNIKEALQKVRASNTGGAGMAKYDFLNSITDANSLLKAGSDSSFMKALDALQEQKKGQTLDMTDKMVFALAEAFQEVTLSKGIWTSKGDAKGEVFKIAEKLKTSYSNSIKAIPNMGDDGISDDFFTVDDGRRAAFWCDSSIGTVDLAKALVKGNKDSTVGYVSLGSVFMSLVANPLAESGQYEEIQVIFYPLNDYAGAVHGCPLSWFPISKSKLDSYVSEHVTKNPEMSLHQMIELLNSRFVGFPVDAAYMMANFYEKKKADQGIAEFAKGTTTASFSATLEERLEKVGIFEKKFIQPKLGVFVEGAPLLKKNGDKLRYPDGRTKTLIKIHVFDASSTATRTLGEMLTAARDDQLGVIVGAVSSVVRDTVGSPGTIVERRGDLAVILAAGEAAGLLELLDTSDVKSSDGQAIKVSPMYAVKGDYNQIKRLVSAGMPTFTYGTSNSGIINASLASANSAGLGNAMMVRSFQAPGEVAPDVVDGGVPMQLIPAQLSLSTFGCPLFFPMQRVFVDFGTGTSIDNVYFVLGAEHKIGPSGFKTDVKMSYGEGFATYTSLSQNLAMMAVRVKNAIAKKAPGTAADAGGSGAPSFNLTESRDEKNAFEQARTKQRELLQDAGRAIGKALAPAARVALEVQMKIDAEIQKVKDRVALEIEAAKLAAIKKIEEIIPEEVKITAAEAKKKAEIVQAKYAEVSYDVERALLIVDLIMNADKYIAAMGAEAASIIMAEAKAELDRQLKANPPKKPKTKPKTEN